jgi:DNA polymerase-3 subunit delta'
MSDLPQFLPWQRDTARAWLSRRERFAHAWLLHGLGGIGKRQFALAAGASLLCQQPADGLACGHCVSCQWLASGNHPDFRRIRPDAVAQEEGAQSQENDPASSKKAPSKDIRVDQLRELGAWFNTATHCGGWRVAVLYPAQALNAISANALLKVLEEPPDHTVFLIVADAPDRLLSTLVSRCRRLPMPVPPAKQATDWLREHGVDDAGQWLAAAGGAPLLALRQAQAGGEPCPDWLRGFLQPIAAGRQPELGPLADGLEKVPAGEWMDTLQRLFFDLNLAAAGHPARYFPSLQDSTRQVGAMAEKERLTRAGGWLAQQRRSANHPLNAKLLVQSTLQRVALACRPRAQ